MRTHQKFVFTFKQDEGSGLVWEFHWRSVWAKSICELDLIVFEFLKIIWCKVWLHGMLIAIPASWIFP